MAKKQKSFAEKASSAGGKDLVHVKFVKSVPSNRDGFWRFNESMISMEKGQSRDAKLKEIENEAMLVDIDMPSDNDSKVLESSSVAEAPLEEASVEAPAEAPAEAAAVEAPAEAAAVEAPAEAAVEDKKEK